jgi:hypothetical protein
MSEVPAPPKDKWIAEKTPSQDATPPLPVTSCPSAVDVGMGYVCNDSALVEPSAWSRWHVLGNRGVGGSRASSTARGRLTAAS